MARPTILIGAALFACAAPAFAQGGPMSFAPIAVKPGKAWTHKGSGIELPAQVDGIALTKAGQIGTGELDVSVQYDRGTDLVSLYIYRATSGSVPIWFERAQFSIENRPDVYGTPKPVVPPTAFTPPGQSSASGLIAAWEPSVGGYRGTALAMLPVGEWWVKVRYSSKTLDGAALAARIPALLATLRWPKGIAAQPAAVPVRPCADSLTFANAPKQVTDGDRLMQAMLGSSLLATVKPSGTGGPFCRDASALPPGVASYRLAGTRNAYLIALGDSGRAVTVGSAIESEMAANGARPTYTIALIQPDRTVSFAAVDGLPAPARALQLMGNLPVAATTLTTGKKREIQINSGLIPPKPEAAPKPR